MMMQSFTTVIVVLAATLSPTAMADFNNIMVLITGDDFDNLDCNATVNAEISGIINGCVEDATGIAGIYPTHNNTGRRMLETSTSAGSRQLQGNCPNNYCSMICEMMGWCGYCSNCGDRRELKGERELSVVDDAIIEPVCTTAIQAYALESNHECLGDHSEITVTVRTSD
jgi:hypothetical protein